MELTNLTYYRGCGDKYKLTIKNFYSDSMCGAGIPNIGEKIIVFACGNDENPDDNLRVNNYVAFSGWTKWSWSKENTMRHQTGIYFPPRSCRCARKFEKCLNRKTTSCDVVIPRKPMIMIAPEPILIEEVKITEPVIRMENNLSTLSEPSEEFESLPITLPLRSN